MHTNTDILCMLYIVNKGRYLSQLDGPQNENSVGSVVMAWSTN